MSQNFKPADMFSYEKYSDRIYILKESYSTQHRFPIGLVIGDKKAYVIDSGLGMAGDLKAYIEDNLTQKPLVCIVTHGHLDHASGAVLFDERYLNERDYPILGEALDLGRREAVLPDFALNDEQIIAYGKAHALDNTKMSVADFKNIDEDDVIEDGIKMEIIAMPGHTKGQIAVYIRDEKICFASDSLLKRTHFDKATKEGIAAYVPVLQHFLDIVDDDVVIIPGHEQSYVGNFNGWPTIQLPRDLKQACEDIANGIREGDTFKPAFFKNLEQKGRTFTHIVGCASLLYNEDIFK